MSSSSDIEWTDATWNPVRGCKKVSQGCKHCYAETFAERWRGVPGHAYEHGFDVRLAPGKLLDPLRWTKPRTIFVNSMSDVFQADVPHNYAQLIAEVMALADWHGFQLLTKRAEMMNRGSRDMNLHLPNVIVGVSVEDRRHGVPRIDHLRRTVAEQRFLSIEPLLEDLGELDLRGIDWVIVGGESGPGARPMDPEWVRSIQRQCDAQGVLFFFKQWGGVHKRDAGRILDGRSFDAMPKLTRASVPGPAERRRRTEQIIERARVLCGLSPDALMSRDTVDPHVLVRMQRREVG